MKKFLVTGGCGFVGGNVAARLLQTGCDVLLLDNLSREGSRQNLEWLRGLGKFEFHEGDTRHADDLRETVRHYQPDAIFHLAGQVAMTTSMENPRLDFETNVAGTINLLEAVRAARPEAVIVYSSSNKVYGDLSALDLREEEWRYVSDACPRGVDENFPLNFQTPYGCSKGAADQYMLDYARVYGLNTVVFRHSTIYGGRQYATFDQGWVGWFCRQALEIERNPQRPPFTIAGDGKQVRDLLYIDDAVTCYLAAAQNIDRTRGEAFNIGGGMANSCSLLELFHILEEKLHINCRYERLPWRFSDQKFFVADNTKATTRFGWKPSVDRLTGIEETLAWTRQCL